MKKAALLLAIMLLTATGCGSGNTHNANTPDEISPTKQINTPGTDSNSQINWDYKEGIVIAKENNEVLVVRDEVSDINAPLNELLEEAKPNAIWLGVEDKYYDAVAVGDQVVIYIPNGTVNQSYPAQATAKLFVKEHGFNGYVLKSENNRILVVSSTAQDFSANGGQKNFYEAIWYSDAPSHIEAGMKVAVWSEGALLESFPAQGTAEYVRQIVNPDFEQAKLTEQEAVRQALSSLNTENENEPLFNAIKAVEYDAAAAQWTVYVLNDTRDQVIPVTVADQ